MNQIEPNRKANAVQFGVEKGDTSAPTLNFQAPISAQRQSDGVGLSALQAKLPALTAGELLEGPMINRSQPSAIRQAVTLRFSHVQALGRPVVRLAGWVNRPKPFDQTRAAQVKLHPPLGNSQPAHRPLLTRLDPDRSITLPPRQPVPTATASPLQMVQPAVPTVERYPPRLKPPGGRRFQQRSEGVVLAQPILNFVIKPKVAGEGGSAGAPDQTDQVNSLYPLVRFARPVAGHQRPGAGLGLVQRGIVDDQPAAGAVNTGLHFRPQRLAVRRQALQPARLGVRRRLILAVGMAAGRFPCAKHALRRYQKGDVILFGPCGSVHASDSSSCFSTA